ncbi:MAG: hypothetical protein ACT6FE_05065, partial [Methanosarcinaceae archaeon]
MMRRYTKIGLIGLLIFGLFCGGAMGAPDINDYTPSDSDVSTKVDEEQVFNIHVNETCNITWYINGSQKQFIKSKTDDTYKNTGDENGTYNVTAFVKNENGTDQKKWIWTVSNVSLRITDSDPTDDPESTVYETQKFNITTNQNCTIVWKINGSTDQTDTDVNDSLYSNSSVIAGSYNVTAFVKNINGIDQKEWIWTVSNVSLRITDSDPTDDPESNVDETQKFNITTNQNCTIVWKIDGSTDKTDTDVKYSSYDKSIAIAESYDVTAFVNNENGTDQKKWIWTVSNPIVSLSITDSDPTDDPESTVGETQKFNITTNQNCTIVWKINGSTDQIDTDVKYSSYDNSNAIAGSYNVTAIASDAHESRQEECTFHVHSS